jgi:acetoin utilization deacetylase AcuC-like enzyme
LQRLDSKRREQTGQYREASSLVSTTGWSNVWLAFTAVTPSSTCVERFSPTAVLGSCGADAASADAATFRSDSIEAASCFQARSTARWL